MRRTILLLTIFLAAFSAFADHPTKERGFRADSLYQFTDLDTINLFNGSVNVMLPLGQSYAVSSNLSYTFTLRYASNLWSETEVCGGQQGDTCHIHYTWRNDNAGFGWNLSFGEYAEQSFPKLTTPDGAEHQFFTTLHEGETATTGVSYTRDGTYLRRKEPTATTRIIEFPNGLRHLYELQTSNNTWLLRYIYDSFSTTDATGIPTTNFVSIAPALPVTDALGTYVPNWTITDTVGRTHYVYFKRLAPVITPVVDRIDLQTFNNVRAVYDFGYNAYGGTDPAPITDGAPRTISRPCHNSDDNTATLSVNLLRRLRLTKGNPASSTEPFTAFTMEFDEGIVGSCSATSGLMTSMTVPTLGRFAWMYRLYNFAAAEPFDRSVGVSERLVYDKAGNLVQLRHYDASASGVNAVKTMKVPGTSPSETGATVDFKSVHYFDINDGLDVGLPFTTTVTDGSTTARYLSSETFDCNEASATESCNATPERRQYVKYEHDTCSVGTCTRDINRRVFTDRTQYTTDGARVADTNRAGFDGLGHYRTTATAGTFDTGNVRTETINYNSAAGTYPGSFVSPATTAAWLLETYADKTTTEGTSTSKSQYCFSATTGELDRVRTFAGTTQAINDLLAVYTYDTTGNVLTERYYGGDAQSVSTGTVLCTLTLPASSAYRIAHTYEFGARKTSEYQTSAGASVGFKFADYDIDQSSGWIKTARDSAGFATAFEFDALGRLTWELPASGGDAYTEYAYTPASTSAGASVAILKHTNGSRTSTPLARSEFYFDDIGRPWRERTYLADDSWSLRETGYDWAGRKAYVTEVGPSGATLPRSTYAYDLFGRATTITPADGSAHAVTVAYTGVRLVDRTTKIKTSSASEVSVMTTEVSDRLGRLFQVKEPSRPDGANAITTYTYNNQNKLVGVSMAGQEGTQTRSFNYDGRGFLMSETHPESGTTSYLYDARGHATKRVSGGIDMRTLYDRAERPTTIYESSGAVWKSFTYSTANGVNDLSQGKMTSALRHNKFPEYAQDIIITEGYVYGGRNGRMSQRTTTSSEGTAFTQSFTYNDLGLMSNQIYPACTAVCTGSGISLTNTYTNGFLTAAGTYAGSIKYHPNGLVSEATFGSASSNTKWTQQNDPYLIARPASISLMKLTVTDWGSGAYAYDGAGNIWGIGADRYYYDKASRLVTSAIAGGAATQSQTYDSFGNVKTITTNGSARTFTMTGATTNLISSITDGASGTTGVTYDARGNVTTLKGNTFDYDVLGMARTAGGPARNWIYVYTPGEERIWAYDLAANRSTWTVRGLDNKPLAEWINDGTTGWSGPVNYIYRNGTLHASYSAGRIPSTMYYAPDHLGTPRRILDASGNVVGTHTYYGFGEEYTNSLQDTQRLKFTAHERDFCCDGTKDAIDFMHARQYSGWAGRFLSVDPGGWDKHRPQTWNRYVYAENNPILKVDPDGRDAEIAASSNVNAVKSYLTELMRRPSGRAVVTAIVNDQNFKLRIGTGMLTPPALIQQSLQQKTKIQATFGQVVPTGNVQQPAPGAPGQYVVTGGTMTLDPNAISKAHPDKSGATTAGHEFTHVNDLRTGGVAAMSAGDVPTSATGPAEQAGQAIAAEKTDMSKKDARKLVDQLIPVRP